MAVGRELRSRGAGELADRFELCGACCAIQGCGDCGARIASATVTTSCDLRICPFCARQRARSHVALLSAALLRVPGYVAARADSHVEALRELLTERERVRDLWELRAARARERFEHATSAAVRAQAVRSIERSSRLAAAADDERAQARFDLERAREAQRGGWSWKLVTVSPRWNPDDARAYTVEGLQERAADAWARWELVRERYAAGGLAAAIAKIEASERGHVHVHALVYGPWIKADSASEIAGCFVDVRAIEPRVHGRRASDRARETRGEREQFSSENALRDAITEACKYLAKVPSVLRNEWVQGRSAHTMHPALAASWVLAMRGAKAGRMYGAARDAVACERLQREGASKVEREPHCRCCGSYALQPARFESTAVVARMLGLGWGAVLSLRRQIPKQTLE